MLNKVEHKIMNYIFTKCKGKKSVLMEPKAILDEVAAGGPKYELTSKQLEVAIKNLMLDGYIDVYHSDNKGKLNYVINLTQKGEAYQRELDDAKTKRLHSLGWKVILTVVGVVVGWILVRIIGK